MSKLDELLDALNDTSAQSTAVSDLALQWSTQDFRAAIGKYVDHCNLNEWHHVDDRPCYGYCLMLRCYDDRRGITSTVMGMMHKDGAWMICHQHSDRVMEFRPILASTKILRWRYLPEYPEGGE